MNEIERKFYVICLKYYEKRSNLVEQAPKENPGMTEREIAERLNCTYQNVQQAKRSALRKMKARLEEKGYTKEDLCGA